MAEGEARFAELYERYHPQIGAYFGRRMPADQVDDAVADTFLVAWRRIDDLPSGSDALPWLYGVAHRVLGHQWRGQRRRARLREKLALSGEPSVGRTEDVVVMRMETRRVLESLADLNATDQEILRLAAWEGLSHAEIADVLGISTGAVRQRFYQARKNLTRRFKRMERRQISSPAAQKGGA